MRRGCRTARAGTAPSWRPRADRPASSRCSPCRSDGIASKGAPEGGVSHGARAPGNAVAAVYVDIRARRATSIPRVGLSFKQSFQDQGLRHLESGFVFTFNKS
ncbi:hypothetical protein F01_410376 [Burkholderia cenocepacia]|nr:hypothetical protein F01_410376 [Burkholderia cenocepacia]